MKPRVYAPECWLAARAVLVAFANEPIQFTPKQRAAIDRLRDAFALGRPGEPRGHEWRCRCKAEPDFDKGANPPYVAACVACGAERPR